VDDSDYLDQVVTNFADQFDMSCDSG